MKSVFPPSVLLLAFLAVIFLLSFPNETCGVSISGGQGEEAMPLPPPGVGMMEENSNQLGPNRIKRSKELYQQLCGYRLLDALRVVCDRNFVGFAKRSDPSIPNENDGGRIGDIGYFAAGGNENQLEGGLITQGYATPSRDPNSITGYLELLPEHSVVLPPGISLTSFPWRNPVDGGSSKSLAMRLLGQHPETHQRFRRKIVEECCEKPCHINQMQRYCAISAIPKTSF